MALVQKAQREGLIIANTSNVKEMKNGRPMNVEIPASATADQLANCMIVELLAVKDAKENDHVYTTKVLTTKEDIDKAIAAGTAAVVVAPESMVEEARKTDGHIGLFRFEKGAVHTAYKLQKHDRLEVSAEHMLAKAGYTPVSTRAKLAAGIVMSPDGSLFNGAELAMQKIEF